MITLRTVSDRVVFAGLARDWDEVMRQGPPDEMFCAHACLSAALGQHVACRGVALHVVTLHDEDRLIAGVPMIRRSLGFGISELRWLDSRTSLYNGLICVPGYEPEVFDTLRRHLYEIPRLLRLKVDFVPDESRLAAFLGACGSEARAPVPTSSLTLKADASAWQLVSAKRRKALRRQERLLTAQGPVVHRRVDRPESLARLATWIIARKQDWLRATSPNMARDAWITRPETARYFAEIATVMAATGDAFGAVMTVGDRLAAGQLFFRHGDVAFWSKTAHDPALARYSAGWLGMIGGMDIAVASGIRTVDLMMGNSDLKQRIRVGTGMTHLHRIGFGTMGALSRHRRR